MKEVGKALGTIAVWGGVAGLSYLFHTFDFLNGIGGGVMAFAAILLTAKIWD